MTRRSVAVSRRPDTITEREVASEGNRKTSMATDRQVVTSSVGDETLLLRCSAVVHKSKRMCAWSISATDYVPYKLHSQQC